MCVILLVDFEVVCDIVSVYVFFVIGMLVFCKVGVLVDRIGRILK